jgi:hypothetical protein
MLKLFSSQFRKIAVSFQLLMLVSVPLLSQNILKLAFEGTLSELKFDIKDFSPALPSDWSNFNYLVMEMRTSSPQRFSIWLYRTYGTPVRVMFQPFGQDVWFRASLPLKYFVGMDKSGNDLASANNRRTNSFWFSTWGPFGDIKAIESIGFAMHYPVNKPTVEIRTFHLSEKDEGSEFLEKQPLLDEFGQWANGNWEGKIKSKEQLAKELVDEEKTWPLNDNPEYCEYRGFKNTQAKTTGFFHLEQIDGKWWFVDPHGHLFLSSGSNGAGAGFGGRPGSSNTVDRITPRIRAWGMTTGGKSMPYTIMMRWPVVRETNFLGLPDVYSEEFAGKIDEYAKQQCLPLRDDPLVLGYFVGNEPAFDGRESEVVDMILTGPPTATQSKLKEFIMQGDNQKRRKEFIISAFEKYIVMTCSAIKKYDPNHLTLGIRFGGSISDELLRTGRLFDVCSVNVYEYEPMWQLDRVSRYTGRPVLIGEFHIGVPANGLGAGLVQARDQIERGIAYRYYVEQAASLSCFLGAYWFQWRDEPVMGRGDGENYNIGFVDVNDRPYKELAEAARATNKRLYDVHSGKVAPFNQRPMASDAGTPSSPWRF